MCVISLPGLPPGRKFRGTDSIEGEIAFMQTYEFGFGQGSETPAAVAIDFFLQAAIRAAMVRLSPKIRSPCE
jgi:hypothetical protein